MVTILHANHFYDITFNQEKLSNDVDTIACLHALCNDMKTIAIESVI